MIWASVGICRIYLQLFINLGASTWCASFKCYFQSDTPGGATRFIRKTEVGVSSKGMEHTTEGLSFGRHYMLGGGHLGFSLAHTLVRWRRPSFPPSSFS